MLSLIVDRVETILCNKSICAGFDFRQHKIGPTLSTIKDSTGALVAQNMSYSVYNQGQHRCSCCTK